MKKKRKTHKRSRQIDQWSWSENQVNYMIKKKKSTIL